jgi:hypothetical protein
VVAASCGLDQSGDAVDERSSGIDGSRGFRY